MLDITALGRQEGDLPYPTAWVKLHDEYAGWTSSPVGALFELLPKRQDIAQEAHAPEGCARERSKRGRE
jgi:hypothetical protein